MNFSGQLGQDEIPIEPIKYTFPEDKLKLGALPFKWHIPIILETIFETDPQNPKTPSQSNNIS